MRAVVMTNLLVIPFLFASGFVLCADTWRERLESGAFLVGLYVAIALVVGAIHVLGWIAERLPS